jgi:methionyl-tRNA synthetase
MNKFYITTPIYYPNARPHVGNSYTTMVCDAIVRFKRQCGFDVAFLTGTDEHGEKLERAALAAGLSPQEFVAAKRPIFHNLWKALNISLTHFIYTDRPDHTTSVQRMLVRARDAGYVYKKKYEGRYCVHDERYVSDSTDPVNCDVCGRPAELISEENYFFKLSAFADRLLEHYEKHPEFVQPDFRRNEVVSFVRSGLRDISVSRRRIKWGIPWPGDPEQVFYVWYDALTSYLTGIGFAEGDNGSAEFQKYWPADVHMVGKDIIRFHAVYWPAFLMAAGLPLPKTIFAHGFLNFGGDKMSKSKGNVVYCEPIVEALGADALRYYLLRDIPFGQDSSFSYEGLIQRYNSDLANDLGNLANRTITMLNRYFGGEVPGPTTGCDGQKGADVGGSAEAERNVIVVQNSVLDRVPDSFRQYDFSRGLEGIWHFIGTVNQYLTERQPWVLAEDPTQRERLGVVLRTATQALRIVAVLVSPVLPKSAQKLWEQLGQHGSVGEVDIEKPDWEELPSGTRVGHPEPIFPRLDKEETLARLEELAEADRNRDIPKEALKSVQTEKTPEAAPEPEPSTPSPQPPAPSPVPATESPKISIEDFAKVEMRTGEIKTAEPIPGAKKLLKLTVDIGTEVRQVCAGIAEYYEPEKLIGMKVVVVTNLQPRKLRGVESNGMIVAASIGETGQPVLVTFKEDVPNGARLK